MPLEQLTAISPIDGRYREAAKELAAYFSEFALVRARVRVECEYLAALTETPSIGIRSLTSAEKKVLEKIADISLADAQIVKKIEREGFEGIPATNHDVKAVEYFLKKKLAGTSLVDVSEWIHFAITSEDTDNIAYALLLRGALENLVESALEDIRSILAKYATTYASAVMLARTHGQPASPTTFGKEMRVFHARISRQVEMLATHPILVKFGGATGNWSAHAAAVPEVDWIEFSKKFVERFNDKKQSIKLELNETTTQIEPHDTYAELFDNLRRINTILIDFSQDMWRYISGDWVVQKAKEGEVGSSTMPHKVNPIDFENAEGNLGVANALFEHFSHKLPISRLQRDLSDSTVKRTFGTAFAHSLIGYKALVRGLGKVSINEDLMRRTLEAHPEVIGEAIQTVLRKEGVEVPYEQMKKMTRGKKVSMEDFEKFVDTLKVSDDVKKRLKAFRPENYIGLAERIAKGE
ncbi:adenylosuccinate lyase [Candidatus Kaiserbacteria bacterium RIFCSPHIGHO2_01_FULL_55_17]|uniref:Adenylosuccinate lyase n=1 Tax=Candidatus Kaiserbacteria bacterium RIFCSPHIGHO2_01_FULL_55_17 TaxID=1798484 RepID=A0A1F6DAH5_9BACT|nr:MAG: adenylosuccinate lyase [Candidatus Kaiserbacteria bacterium RIFCSPHIGHO2_01_FULL_55_17]